MKPDILIHPDYYPIIEQHGLSSYYNVLRLEDLRIETDDLQVYLCENDACRRINVSLQPFYTSALKFTSGVEPSATSYWFDETQSLYTIEQNAPRYVIWTKTDPLTVCATCLDRVDCYELYESVQRAKEWSSPLLAEKSIVVFDLDRTLIDDENKPLEHASTLLDYARKTYDLVVLWSHGSALHVDDNVRQFTRYSDYGDELFDVVLSHAGPPSVKSQKNLLYLYNSFPNCVFTKATLVDDSLYNWTPEYNKFIVPRCTSLKHALSIL